MADGADVNAKLKAEKWQDIAGWTPLHNASGADKEVAELLIAEGPDVNAKDRTEWTPLHYAACRGNKEVVELLIANGADVNAKDGGGDTPLDEAIKYDNPETADLLRKHGGKTAKELKSEGK